MPCERWVFLVVCFLFYVINKLIDVHHVSLTAVVGEPKDAEALWVPRELLRGTGRRMFLSEKGGGIALASSREAQDQRRDVRAWTHP